MSKIYNTPFGEFKLCRIPDDDPNLQAWSSADTYLLNHIFELEQQNDIELNNANILVINDEFGALTIPLAQFGCDSMSDSFISHSAMKKNLGDNYQKKEQHINFIKSTESLEKIYDIVLFKNTKTQAFLKDEMLKIQQHIHSETLIVGASMVKNLPQTTIRMLELLFDQVKTSLAWKKARLIHIKTEPRIKKYTPDIASFVLEDTSETIYSLANVFSRNKLDIGARFLLDNFPTSVRPEPEHIIDLGCGNGVLSLRAAQVYPQSFISCVDESYMAVASAQMTLEKNIDTKLHRFNFICSNALEQIPDNTADMILCNPPFHQQYVIGDAIAWLMFKQSKKVLKKGGTLWVVGNRHLGYHKKLKRLFGRQKLIAGNDKFVILKAEK